MTERQPAREGTQQGRWRGGSRLPAEEPDVGLDPASPGSRPEPKAVALTTALPRRPSICSLIDDFYDQFIFNFYIRQDVRMKVLYCFAYGYLTFPAPFVEKIILYPLDFLDVY